MFYLFFFLYIGGSDYIRLMIRVVLLGAGNLAVHLAKGLEDAPGIRLVQHYSRTAKNNSYFPTSVPRTNDLKKLKKADLYLIAVKDEAIGVIGSELKECKGLVVHTEGTIPMGVLGMCPNHGVFYPVQTFSKDREIKWSNIPLALETARSEDMVLLKTFASQLSDKIFEIDSKSRKHLHLAAVFANNFSNHMFTLSKELCLEGQLPFELVKPLIQETARKIMVLEPEDAQTGPARRRDELVMEEHRSQLDQEKKEIYSLLSESIAKRYGEQSNE